MQHRPLGNTGMVVSVLSLGTVKFGRREGVKYPGTFEIPSEARCLELIELAESRGVNLLDTAPAYGDSEDRIGKFLQRRRDRWLISTKVGEEFEEGRSRFDFSPASIRFSVERSLQRLRTDCLDVVLLHSDGVVERDLAGGGTLDALKDLRRRGLARAVGVSAKTTEGATAAIGELDVVMVTLNPSDRSCEAVIHDAAERCVGVLIKKALGSGHLPGSLGFALGHAGVSSVVVGTINPAHLAANCDAADLLASDAKKPSEPPIP